MPSVVPSICSSSATSPPPTRPSGPSSVLPTVLTVTSSNAIPGVFSVRYASPTFGSAGMIMAAGPSLPAIQVPSLVTIAPSSKSATSSPKYQTDPSSAWAYRSYATSWMRPSRYAVYWETSVSIRWPCHSMILVSGSNVTSVLNGLPSTWPTISTESCLDTGNSGLVTLVGSEKVGMLRSTRLLLGATGISTGTGGWGITLDPPAVSVDAAERAPVAILPGLSSLFAVVSDPHACTIDRLANNTKTSTPRATGLMRLPSMFLLCNPFLFGHPSPGVSHVIADFGLHVLDS